MNADCFVIEPTGFALTYLRRYSETDGEGTCPLNGYYHDSKAELGRASAQQDVTGIWRVEGQPEPPQDDLRWPRRCGCGYVFVPGDTFQVFNEVIYTGGDRWSGSLRNAPPGAIWEAPWLGDWARVNGDGPVLTIMLPSEVTWEPGRGASNCTRKGEDHDCWCVHGTSPRLTVDKTPEPGRTTCQAGAGSIDAGGWHGFLRNGVLEEC